MSIICKSDEELATMAEAGKIVAGVLELLRREIQPGVSTGKLDKAAERYIQEHGGTPAFKGYRGFPASICVSVNEAVVHGIPGSRLLVEGDVVSLDVGVIFNGYVADAATTAPVGEIDAEAERLMTATRDALAAGINECVVDNHLFDVSHAIQQVAEDAGFSVVREYVGHGIGRDMHEDPPVPNFGVPGKGPRLRAGMTLALEPMINAGESDVEVSSDGWTVLTRDRRPSAHFEHTVAVTTAGPRILTVA